MSEAIITIDTTENGIELKTTHAFTSANLDEIKTALIASIMRKGPETLSLENATSIDVTGIQLAYVWKKTLDSLGRKAIVILPQTTEVKDLLEKTGLTQIF